MLSIGSLFSGIGGIEYGLEMTGGFKTVWQVEIDDYANRVLEKHWPNVRRWKDINDFPCWPCDVLTFGSPCQGISNQGKKEGLKDERSKLFYKAIECLRNIRPRYAIMENVAALLHRGMGEVLREFSESGYDAEWDVFPAACFGAPHLRERLFIVAYPESVERVYKSVFQKPEGGLHNNKDHWQASPWDAAKSRVCGVDDGVPDRVHRTECLGNAVVPQITEFIGRCILNRERSSKPAEASVSEDEV